jgi:hypothetical protein
MFFGAMGSQRLDEMLPIDYVPLQSDNTIEQSVLSPEEKVAEQMYIFPQEKIYIQTDRPYYAAGDNLFFRAFLLDARRHRPSFLSRYVYVELINNDNEVVKRHQIRADSNGVFSNAIELPKETPTGTYRLRAYTRYMQNIGEEFFFSKPVFIAQPFTQYPSDTDMSDSGVRVSNPLSQGVRVSNPLLRSAGFQPAHNRSAGFQPAHNESADSQPASSTHENTTTTELTFYPEGGALVEGTTNKVAFKALHNNGLPANIEGTVVDSEGKTVTTFQTLHEGMGAFNFFPETGKNYFALFNNNDSVALPNASLDAITLNAAMRNNGLWLSLNRSTYNYSDTAKKMLLMAHCRGNVLLFKEWELDKNYFVVDNHLLPTGVTHFLLLTQNFEPVSERLVFFNRHDEGKLAIKTDSNPTFNTRDLIRLDLQQLYDDREFFPASLAVSVTDDATVQLDTSTNILAEILLASELRGYIRNPAFYLQDDDIADKAADLLMMTHGWTRYDIPEVLKGNYSMPNIPFERSQSYSGKVRGGVFGNLKKDVEVSMLFFKGNTPNYDMTKTDDEGRYSFENKELTDSACYLLQVRTKNGKSLWGAEILPDTVAYPPVTVTMPIDENYTFDENLIQNKLFKNDLILRTLPEMSVVAKNPHSKYRNSKGVQPDFFITDDRIADDNIKDMQTLLKMIPDLRIRSGGDVIDIPVKHSSTISNQPVYFYINGDVYFIDDYQGVLNEIPIEDIAEIDLINDLYKIQQYYEAGPVIEIMTKNAVTPDLRPRMLNIKVLNTNGYKRPVEFYSPRYDTPQTLAAELPDLRNTIYWKPNVLANEAGKASVEFYAADTPTTYSVVIEGVCPDGTLIYKRCNGLVNVK